MTDFYSQNRCVCSTRSHGPLLCAFCLSFHFKTSMVKDNETVACRLSQALQTYPIIEIAYPI